MTNHQLKTKKVCSIQLCVLTWKSGEIFHMSIGPAPKVCPNDAWKANKGTPNMSDNIKNCKMKFDPKCMLNTANLLMLKRPRVQPNPAKTELKPCGHGPMGLLPSDSSGSSSTFRLLLLKQNRKNKKLRTCVVVSNAKF